MKGVTIEPTGNSEKSEPQMGKDSLTFARFGGWLAASFSDALNVTARCSYELCCRSIFDSVAA